MGIIIGLGNKKGGGGGGDTSNCVKVTSQSFTEQQKAQARTNIGAGTYTLPDSGIPATDLAPGVIPAQLELTTQIINTLWDEA